MCGPLCDAPYASIEPPLRAHQGELRYRSPLTYRVALVAGAVLAAVFALAARTWEIEVAAGAATVALVAASRRAGAWRPLVADAGWYHGTTVLGWEELEVIKLHATEPGRALIKTRDGTHRSLWEHLPTNGPAGWFGSEEAICRLAHQVAHQVGRQPVPVIVGDGSGAPARFLDPHCATCSDLGP